MRLKGKVAIITGAGKGIGRETALLFAMEGASVVVADFNAGAGEATCAEIIGLGAEAIYCQVNVTNRSEVKAMVEVTKKRFGRIDILLNNAGITADAMLLKMTESQWDSVISINLKGVFNCAQAVLPTMAEQEPASFLTLPLW